MGGGGGGTTNTVQKSDPWSGQQPYLLDLFSKAQARMNSDQPQFFPGSTVAPRAGETTEGQDYLTNVARNTLPQFGQTQLNQANFNMGQAQFAESNPYLQSAINAAMNPVIQRFTEAGGPLQQIRSEFGATAPEGTSTRQGIAEGIALKGLSGQLTDMSGAMAFQNYQNAQDNALKTLALAPGVAAAQTMPAEALQTVGGQKEAFAQQLLNSEIARHDFGQNVEANKLSQYAALIGGGGLGGNAVSSMESPAMNPFLTTAAGGIGGYALANAMPALGITGPWGAGIGALLALMSTRR